MIAPAENDWWARFGRFHSSRKDGKAFEKAAAPAPSVMIINGIDALPSRGKNDQFFWDTAVAALLEAMGGLDSVPGVVVVGICNNDSFLDEVCPAPAGSTTRSVSEDPTFVIWRPCSRGVPDRTWMGRTFDRSPCR